MGFTHAQRMKDLQLRARVVVKTSNLKIYLYIYFHGAATNPFAACSVNDKGCQEEAMSTKQSRFPNVHFSRAVFVAVAVVAAQAPYNDGGNGNNNPTNQ